MDYGTAGFAVHHQFPELAQTHVHAAVTIPKNVEGALQTGLWVEAWRSFWDTC